MNDPFIKSYENAIPDETCDAMIKFFEMQNDMGMSVRRKDTIRRDNQLEMADPKVYDSMEASNMSDEIKPFFDMVGQCLGQYSHDLSLDRIFEEGQIYARNAIIQKSISEEFDQYGAWHAECEGNAVSNRVMTYLVYLNDDFEGGETEFLYQQHREKPKKGKLVLFPAYLTHIHRGGLITSGTKYIATGWYFWGDVTNF